MNTTRSRRSQLNKRARPLGRLLRRYFEPLEVRQLLSTVAWVPGTNLPTPLGNIAAAVAGNGAIVVVGGGSATGLYFGANAWTAATALDTGVTSPAIGLTSGGMLVYGGSDGGSATSTATHYDPASSDNTVPVASMSTPRTLMAYAVDSSGRAYAIGGRDATGARLASVERFDPTTGAWSTLAPLPVALSGAAAVNDGAGDILVFGGATGSASATTTVYRYTVATGSWSTLAPMPVATTEAGAVLGSDGVLYVIGGRDATGAAEAAVQAYTLSTNTWTTNTPLPSPVADEAVISDAFGRIEVIGGYNAAHQPVATVTVSQYLNQPDAAPVITSTPVTQISSTGVFTYQVTATANPQPVFSLTAAPTGMTIDPNSGLITWTPTSVQSGTQNVTVQAANRAGQNAQSFALPIAAPVITTTALTTASANAAYSYQIQSSGNPSATFSLLSGPAGMTVSSSGLISWSPATANIGNQSLTVQASNAVGSTSQAFTLGVKGLPPANVTAAGASTTSVQVSWSPVSDPATYNLYRVTFTHSPRGSGGTYHYNLVASGITGTSYTLGGLPQSSISTSYEFVVTSVDSQTGLQSAYSAPAYAQTWYAPDVYVFTINGADWGSPVAATVGTPIPKIQFAWYANPNPVFTLVSGPSGMSIDPNTSLITWTPAPADAGTVTAVFQATNPVGSQTMSITFNVAPDLQVAPVMTWPQLASPIVLGTPWDATQMNATVTDATTGAVVAGTTTYTAIVPNTTVSITLINPTSLGAGNWVVTASFVPTDAIHYTGVSATQTLLVSQATSTTTLQESSTTSVAGDPVTFTASVTPSSGWTPTGTIDFMDGTTDLGSVYMDVYGNASLTTSALSVSDHAITAVYSGDVNTVASTSAPVTQSVTINSAIAVVGRSIFYNNSTFDGNIPAPNAADDAAIDPTKAALLPGQTATFANYTSYDKGINGIIVDIANPANAAALAAGDFTFQAGTSGDPSTWAAAPAPAAVLVRPGAGVGGSTRVEITWADGAIVNQWLQVTVMADANTGLSTNDVFYFGNAVGDSGTDPASARVDSMDELAARAFMAANGPATPVPVGNPYDFNRDGLVNASDLAIARNNVTCFLNQLPLITAPAPLLPQSVVQPLTVSTAPAPSAPSAASTLGAGAHASSTPSPLLPLLSPLTIGPADMASSFVRFEKHLPLTPARLVKLRSNRSPSITAGTHRRPLHLPTMSPFNPTPAFRPISPSVAHGIASPLPPGLPERP